ncbi:p-loop containing nucleoside triphosphate hydrolase protein [Mycena kentingensis (nom. inval.)]|nr:p-loop containing nucleoside triphosphate hydrolase protein [Mycena kentingensis (nom. inval.)]
MSHHKVSFKWPNKDAHQVIATGSFDNWASSVKLEKTENGFEGSTLVPYGEKILFKYVVDGAWLCDTSASTETDESGNQNNVYHAPPKPDQQANGTHEPEAKAEAKINDPAPALTGTNVTGSSSTFSKLAADIVDTVVAREGTASVLEYVASGVGAALGTTIVVDPINGVQEAVETPAATNTEFNVAPTSAAEQPAPSPSLAPVVPMAIVPVNSANGDALAQSSPPESEIPNTHSPLPASLPTPSAATPSEKPAEPQPEVIVDTVAEIVVPASVPVPEAPQQEAESVAAAPEAVSTSTPVNALVEQPVTPEPTPAVSDLPVLAKEVAPVDAAKAVELPKATTPVETTVSTPPPAEAPKAAAPSTPTTISKASSAKQPFPSSESANSTPAASPSKMGTTASRKARKSIFGKLKNIFSDKDKEDKEKK